MCSDEAQATVRRANILKAIRVLALFYLIMAIITVHLHLYLGLTHWLMLGFGFFGWPHVFPYESAWPLIVLGLALTAGIDYYARDKS